MAAPLQFKDHFSSRPDAYERHRPSYPPALYEWLAGQAPGRQLAVDVATGNGQAAVRLAGPFAAVIALEPSAAQLGQARQHPRVEYRQAAAESLPLADASADLIAVAQAAHWFDWNAFIAEVGRVLRPAGILAVWTYGFFEAGPAIERLVEDFSRDAVGPYWPRERRHVDDGYRDLAVPFPAVATPAFAMQCDWDFEAAFGYIGTWSAVQRARARTGRNPLDLLAAPLAAAWGPGTRRVTWPLTLKVHRV